MNIRSSQILLATNELAETIDKRTRDLQLYQDSSERQDVLHWLSSLNFLTQQSNFSGRRQEGTGTWLLNSSEFLEWRDTAGKTIVCQGMPGAGRSSFHLGNLKRFDLTTYVVLL